jgi:SAM-dependent methyltransferase
MGVIGGALGYHLLRWLGGTGDSERGNGQPSRAGSKVEALFGPTIWDDLAGKVVIDFGCGTGQEAIDVAEHGARLVIGIDIRESVLEIARRAANDRGAGDRCVFAARTDARADAILTIDAFEHFSNPAGVLQLMSTLLKRNGRIYATFGPPWYHPLGGHLFSVFPWAHLLFTERALIRWRSDFKLDGARRFTEVAGGLNLMTVRRFERLVERSPFRFERFEAVPIRRLRMLSTPLTREFCTSVVRCTLVLR